MRKILDNFKRGYYYQPIVEGKEVLLEKTDDGVLKEDFSFMTNYPTLNTRGVLP